MERPSHLGERVRRRLYLAALAVLLVGLMALVGGTSIWSYRQVRGQVEQELEERLLSIGQAIAEGLGANRLQPGSAADSVAQLATIRDDLQRIAQASDLGSIEVIDAKRRHLVGTLETTRFGQRNLLLVAQPEVAAALAGIPASTPLYEAPEVPGAFFKTGFVPIEDPSGGVLGVVAVEGGSGFFQILPSLRRTWWITGAASLVIATVLAVLLFGVFRALERYETGLRGAAALATAGQLAAIVAHEIRNPLAALQSRAERVQDEMSAGADPAKIAGLLDAIPFEVRRLDRILTNYLSIARVREAPGSCAVATIVQETMELVEKEMVRVGVKTSLEAEGHDLRARIDPGPLRQAVLNLFLNAREAMPDGGELRIRIRSEGSWVRLEIEDTGRGIDPKLRRRIFEPFFTTRPTGSGLGLAVVDSVVRSCGGRVDVRSAPGRGTTFILLLPRDGRGETDAG